MCVGLDANRRVIAVSDGIFSFCVDATHPPELVAHALGERRVRSNFCEIKFIEITCALSLTKICELLSECTRSDKNLTDICAMPLVLLGRASAGNQKGFCGRESLVECWCGR